MSFQLRISNQAQSDIEEVLAWTLREFGELKYDEYCQLIREALIKLSENPEVARHRPELNQAARTLHISSHSRRARHFFLLRVTDNDIVEAARLLYDGMDLAAHLPADYEA